MLGITNRRSFMAALALIAVSLTLIPAARANLSDTGPTRSAEIVTAVRGSVTRVLPFAADNVALYWPGHSHAHVSVAFSRDGVTFGPAVDAGRDDVGAERGNGVTYGAILSTERAIAVRIRSSEPMRRLTTLALADKVHAVVDRIFPKPPAKATMQPPIIARSEWGADESLRYASDGHERWKPAFAPVQKLIVHHTVTGNNDPHPATTVRAIYRYHAITQGWGDIGYNFLIDEAGRIYKGRNSHAPGSTTDTITGEDAAGNGVTGAHASHFNSGTVGIALLGTLTNQDTTAAAKNALESVLAWKADKHGIDPNGASLYTNPVDGNQRTFPNIAGHRDTGRSTQCPGEAFYNTLPAVRAHVAARMS
jgi:hypothetical protein